MKKKRNRSQTREAILNAVGSILNESGFQGLGVNAISREAGCDKVLIYRYFGGMEGLVFEYLKQTDLLSNTTIEEPPMDEKDFAEKLTFHIDSYLRILQYQPDLLEIMRWEMFENNVYTDYLKKMRDPMSTKIAGILRSALQGTNRDLVAGLAVIIGGVSYLSLRERTTKLFLGIPIRTDAGRERIRSAAIGMLRELSKENKEHEELTL